MTAPDQPSATLETCIDAYRIYLATPDAVAPGWRDIFVDLDDEAKAWLSTAAEPAEAAPPSQASASTDVIQAVQDAINAMRLVRSYRVRGHLEANLDPLRLTRRNRILSSTRRPMAFWKPISIARSTWAGSSESNRPRSENSMGDCDKPIAAP
jgi:2-oxoglutarate dehydrogenase complex dehydrogenase (E1) component-like enzyme